jgi:predicted nucleic acid-binding protein
LIATHCMSGERFTLDTNILVYSVDQSAGARHQLAKLIVRRAIQSSCLLTLQAISEFYAVATRKQKMPVSDAARVASDMMAIFPMVAGSASAIRAALATACAGTASYWDALLIATAAEAGCTAILTEDLSDGATLLGVQILNPFGVDGLMPAAEALLAID